MITYNALRHLRDAYCDSPNAVHLCDFSPEFATAWQDPTRRETLCELARRFLRTTDRESDWTAPEVPSIRYDSLFRPKNVFVTCADSHRANHNIRVDFLNWLLEQPEITSTDLNRYIKTGSRSGKSDHKHPPVRTILYDNRPATVRRPRRLRRRCPHTATTLRRVAPVRRRVDRTRQRVVRPACRPTVDASHCDTQQRVAHRRRTDCDSRRTKLRYQPTAVAVAGSIAARPRAPPYAGLDSLRAAAHGINPQETT